MALAFQTLGAAEAGGAAPLRFCLFFGGKHAMVVEQVYHKNSGGRPLREGRLIKGEAAVSALFHTKAGPGGPILR